MKTYLSLIACLVFLASCSSHYKKRQEMREKVSASSGLYCEFISGDQFTDLDVELNLQIAKKCEVDKNYSITNYKNASDQIGVIYCCQIQKKTAKATLPVKNVGAPNASGGKSDAAGAASPATPGQPAPSDTDTLDE